MKKKVPIIIFTYRRNIDKLIKSLLKNSLSKETKLFIFSDSYKNELDKVDVLSVRKSLKRIHGFNSITIFESSINKGLADSVIYGVSKIIKEYEEVIVLEDDLIVSKDFLEYMNGALNFYRDNEDIWSISGYTPAMKCLDYYEKDVFLSLRANSWGWATWKNRWDKIDWNIQEWNDFKNDNQAINSFNKGGNDLFKMLETQMLGKIDSWAIRWCYNQFKYTSYTVYPTKSKLINNGFDDKGTHNSSGMTRWHTTISHNSVKFENINLNMTLLKCFANQYDLRVKTKIGYLLKKYGGYKIVKKIIG